MGNGITLYQKNNGNKSMKFEKKGVDIRRDGINKDERKAKKFFLLADRLSKKTVLEEVRATVFHDRYSMKNEQGEPTEEYPEQMWYRVSRAIAQYERTSELQEKWAGKFFDLMDDFKFVPGGRILSGAGTGYEVTFFNCYVIPSPKDSRGGIMENITHTVEIQARAGGVGINLSSLRPSGARVKKVNGTSSGPVNWASLYSAANHDVIQQGGSRRGALMLMLADWHPDLAKFIKVKEDLTKIPGANLSICVSDGFMRAVKNDEGWDLIFPDLDDPEYDEVWDGDMDKWKSLGKKVKVYETVRAKEIWEMVAEAAWKSAEPGVVFLERYNKESNTAYFEKIICVNPCGEQGLGAWSVCNLGAINLAAYVDDMGGFDYESLKKDVVVAMRFMDDVIEANYYFYKENEEAQRKVRRTGLGTMGLGDTLIKMKIRYGSQESLVVIDKIYRVIRDSAYRASVDLAVEKGSFLMFDRDKFSKGAFIQRLPEDLRKDIYNRGIRNAVILTQAPTGTTSLLAGVSSGIEPIYDFEMRRRDRTGESIIYHPLYKKWKEEHEGEKVPDYFIGAKDLTPEDHILVQAKIQEMTDSSISKTVNAPESFTVEEVKKLYDMAYDLGCKGVTFFRDGSRQGVLESIDSKVKVKETETVAEMVAEMRVRPKRLAGVTYEVKTPVGTAFVTVNTDELGNPFEVFINIGRAGSHVLADAEAMGRLISLSFRVPSMLPARTIAEAVVDQLSGIGGSESVGFGNGRVRSLADGVAKVLKEHLSGVAINGHAKESPLFEDKKIEGQQEALPLMAKKRDLCPDCGQPTLVLEEGCAKCYSCGASKC
jgi:ribonucleoside-diphosphate reductase alpha chain